MFQPTHINRSHSFDLPLPAGRAFPLFTPRGEEAWVPGWCPIFLYPIDGELQAGGVFTTQSAPDEQTTIWLVSSVEVSRFTVAYVRITPGSRIGQVEVTVSPHAGKTCRVHVSYVFTSLTEAGNQYLSVFTEDYFGRYIDSWRDLIMAHLQGAATTP